VGLSLVTLYLLSYSNGRTAAERDYVMLAAASQSLACSHRLCPEQLKAGKRLVQRLKRLVLVYLYAFHCLASCNLCGAIRMQRLLLRDVHA